jgi:uncharacterized phiE125 gp8 family phage protein
MSDYTSTAAAFLPVSLEDVKAHLNVSHATDDALLDGYIRAATTLLEARTNRCFVAQTRKCVMNEFADKRYVHGGMIYPPRSPLKSVSSITYVNSSAGTTSTMPSSDYVVSAYDRPGRIGLAYDASWPSVRSQPNNVTVTYVAGHSTVASGVPYNVKLALQMIVAHWYRNRESHTELALTELPMGVQALLEGEHLETYG